jgi:hypothetical protein
MATRTRTRTTTNNETENKENEMSEQQVTEQPTELEETLAASIAAKTDGQVDEDEPAEVDEPELETTKQETETEKVEAKPEKPTPISPVTPFQACKRVNAALAAAGLNKKIQAPMLYTYASKDKFVTRQARKVTQKGIEKMVMEIDEDSFMDWMEGYVADVIAKATGTRKLQQVVDEESAKVDSDPETAEDAEDDSTPAEAE